MSLTRPTSSPYEEEWLPGCFDHQLNAANRIHANYEHGKGIADVVGHGVSLRAEADGYHVTSTIHQTHERRHRARAAERRRAAVRVAGGGPVEEREERRRVMQRVKANLRGFAFCRQGAFAGAQVLAVRAEDEEPEQTLDAALMPVRHRPGARRAVARARGCDYQTATEGAPRRRGHPRRVGHPR